MTVKIASISRKDLKGLATGLIMMAIFTIYWAGCAYYGLTNHHLRWLLLIFPLSAIVFIYQVIILTRTADRLPSFPSESEANEKKKGKGFAITLAGEGIGIFLAINIVTMMNRPELKIPAMALVVGLHFIPLAKVFNRKFDYYIGTWSICVAILAITLSINKLLNNSEVLVFTGVGMAISTVSYGLRMFLTGCKALHISYAG